MSVEVPSPALIERVRRLLGLAGGSAGTELPDLSLPALLQHTRRQLLECAKLLGLTGLSRLTKDALARHFHETLRRIVPGEPEEPADRARRFELGRRADAPRPVEHIPWSYGQDRVTAMVVDPERLYVYWEATDEAIERARQGLGAGGPTAWLNLRVYDVSGRIFDGTNAHDYFDHRIERTDRQWFFHVGQPTSTAIVELGLKSRDGYFVRVARSGRAEFPRRNPTPASATEWLAVRSASGEIGEPREPRPRVSPPVAAAADVGAAQVEPVRVWDIRRTHGGSGWVMREERFGMWSERTFEWTDVDVVTWEAGPFSLPGIPPVYVEERHPGPVTVETANGKTRVLYGPWRVVIRGLGARAERKVLAVWEVYRSWVAQAGAQIEGWASHEQEAGASEHLAGASERRWLAGSEVRLGGASEFYVLGASERRWLGASERVYAGASEWRYAGASEWRLGGASEFRYAGASEERFAGASERVHDGARESTLGYPHRREPEGGESRPERK